MSFAELDANFLLAAALSLLARLGAGVVVFLAGGWLARRSRALLRPVLARTQLTDSMVTLFVTGSYYLILVLALLTSLAILGVPVTSLVAASGIVVVIIAIALQQSLGDFAATIIFLLFRPFEVGEFIETSGIRGRVREIELFNTVILGLNNRLHVLPNAKIQQNGVTNYSRLGTVGVEMDFDISYGDDIQQAKTIIAQVLAADARIRPEPPPRIFVKELGESGVRITARPFVNEAEYWDVRFDMLERVKIALQAGGLTIPFPQRDVHFYPATGLDIMPPPAGSVGAEAD